MTQPSGNQTPFSGRPEATGSVPAEVAAASAANSWEDLGLSIWQRYGSAPGLVSTAVSRELDARWGSGSASSRLPLVGEVFQRWTAPETMNLPDRQEFPLVWPGVPGQPADSSRAMAPTTPRPADNEADPLPGLAQRRAGPAARRAPAQLHGAPTGTQDHGAAQPAKPGHPAGTSTPRADGAPAAALAQEQSNLGLAIMTRHYGLPLVSRASISGFPSREDPVAGRPTSPGAPVSRVLPQTRGIDNVGASGMTAVNPPNSPISEQGADSPISGEGRGGSTPLLKGYPGELSSITRPGIVGGEGQNPPAATQLWQDIAAGPSLPTAGAGAYSLGLDIAQRYGGAVAQLSPNDAGPILPFASVGGEEAIGPAGGPPRRTTVPDWPGLSPRVTGKHPPTASSVSHETTAPAGPADIPDTHLGGEILSRHRPLIPGEAPAHRPNQGRTDPADRPAVPDGGRGPIAARRADVSPSRGEALPVVPPVPMYGPGLASPQPEASSASERGRGGTGQADAPISAGALPLPRFLRSLDATAAASLPTVIGSATPFQPAGRVSADSSPLATEAWGRAPLLAGGANDYVYRRPADPIEAGQSESSPGLGMPLARRPAQSGAVDGGNAGGPAAGAVGAILDRSAPGTSTPTLYRSAVPTGAVINRQSVPSSPPPPAPDSPPAPSGSELGEGDLERLADRVYTILQRRLVLEKESLGL